jgi:hypothetical protein
MMTCPISTRGSSSMHGSKHHTSSTLAGAFWTLVALALALSPPGSSRASADEEFWSPPALTREASELPEARAVVRHAIDFVESHDQLAFEALVTYEVVQKNGQKLQFDMLHRVAVERSARIHWVTLHDNGATETAWCGDGTFTLLREPANLWGRVNVPPDLKDAILGVSKEYKVAVPFVDLLSGDVGDLWLGKDVKWVDYVGEAWVEGQWTDHVALRRPGIDVQLWFRKGDEPFPVKMSIIRTNEDGLPSFSARFRVWSTRIADGAIPKFVPPEGSEQVEVVPVHTP